MQQKMFADMSFEQYRKTIRRERFLVEMNRDSVGRPSGSPGPYGTSRITN